MKVKGAAKGKGSERTVAGHLIFGARGLLCPLPFAFCPPAKPVSACHGNLDGHGFPAAVARQVRADTGIVRLECHLEVIRPRTGRQPTDRLGQRRAE